MGRLINSTYVSLDGAVQHPERFTFGFRSDDGAKYAHDLLYSADAVLMGKNTYDAFAAVWPTANDEAGLAERMNALPRYVVSDTLTDPSWANTHVIPRADARDRVRRLKSEFGTIVQYGFGPVTTDLLGAGLVDEIRLWIHPVLVGASDPAELISYTHPAARLELLDVVRCTSGLLILVYRPATEVADA